MIVRGRGILYNLINKLPFEIHFKGWNYCGPGTKLAKWLARGDKGINPLDNACMEHDISYSNSYSIYVASRNAADEVLAKKSLETC